MNPQSLTVQRFLPFCRAVLLGGSPSCLVGQLPLRKPAAMTAEVVAALQDMINKAVMGWLIRGIGWRRLPIPDGEETFKGRIWDEAIWGDLKLTFTAESIDTLLLAWNLLAEDSSAKPVHPNNRKWRKMNTTARKQWKAEARKRVDSTSNQQNEERVAGLSLTTTGDLLLHHLVFRSLHRRKSVMAGLWMANPLNLMAFYTQGGLRSPEECTALSTLLTGPLAPLMPWISAEWPTLWRDLPGPESLDGLRRQHFNQAMVFSAWIQTCEEAHQQHLLIPLIAAYADQRDRLPATRTQLATFTASLPLTIRQPAQRQWADALTPMHTIYRCHQSALRTHPVDRKGTERILLARSRQHDLPTLHRDLSAAVNQLNDSIG
ncbi:MAG: hypothetical protein ACI8RZ_006357 [Myxococcota bacterium]|jgi:hypothetical protein